MLNWLSKVATGAALAVSMSVTSLSAQEGPFYLIDFVMLNDGYGLEERTAYEEKIAPIAKDAGLEVVQSYDLAAHLNGLMADAVRLNIWKMDSPTALQTIFNDPRYVAVLPERDAIHNMETLTLYMASGKVVGDEVSDLPVLVDLVVMNEGADEAARDGYEAKIEPIAAKHGLTMTSSFPIMQKLAGVGPESPMRLNIWTLEDPKAMQNLGSDPAYAATEEERLALHDFSQLTLFMGTPPAE